MDPGEISYNAKYHTKLSFQLQLLQNKEISVKWSRNRLVDNNNYAH